MLGGRAKMCSILKLFFFQSVFVFCVASFHEQYRVPFEFTNSWESYVLDGREYVLQNMPVSWENAKIICQGHFEGSLAILDTKEKAEFMAEALSESQFSAESVWLGVRRTSALDPAGYRWFNGLELRRTALDVRTDEEDARHYPAWLNRTHVPVPDEGADCVALERVYHDKPVFVDLPCSLDRSFVCEREAKIASKVTELRTVRCRSGLYHVYGGLMTWHEAAAYCVLHKMTLANIATMRCLKKLGTTMLKTRPSIENAWVGARGTFGRWTWLDSGDSIFHHSNYLDVAPQNWPPMRDRTSIKQNGCLQLDRHASHPPVFLEARCERKMQFICYQNAPSLRLTTTPPSDDNYYYVLVRQPMYWQHAFENCLRMNGTLAAIDSNEVLVQLLLVMGENKEEPLTHIWISGRLNMTMTDAVTYTWRNPVNGRRIPDPRSFPEAASTGLYMPPWLDDEFTLDAPCLNLDRQDHLIGLLYGLPCDTQQASVCMIEKSLVPATTVRPLVEMRRAELAPVTEAPIPSEVSTSTSSENSS